MKQNKFPNILKIPLEFKINLKDLYSSFVTDISNFLLFLPSKQGMSCHHEATNDKQRWVKMDRFVSEKPLVIIIITREYRQTLNAKPTRKGWSIWRLCVQQSNY